MQRITQRSKEKHKICNAATGLFFCM